MDRWLRVFVAVATVGCVVAVASAQAARGPVLAWSPMTSGGAYDFGTFDVAGGQTPKPVTFTLKNSGGSATGELAVTVANTGGTAFSITSDGCSGRSLGPRKSCRVTVAFAPGGGGESDDATLTANGERASASLALSGKTVAPSLVWSSAGATISSYDFGAVDAVGGKTATQTFTLTNSGTGTTGSLTASVTDSQGTAFSIGTAIGDDTCTGATLAPGNSCTVTVVFAPKTSGESDTGTLSAGGASLSVTGSGGTASVAWSPTTSTGSYDYGAVAPGSTGTQTFTLTNNGTGTTGSLTALVANSTGTAFSIGTQTGDDTCTGATLAPGHSCTVTVLFAPAAGGESDSGTLSAGGASLSLTGTGASPSLAWSQGETTITSYAYGTVPAGNIASQTFTLTNSGTSSTGSLTSSLSGTGFSIGTAVGDDTCTGAILAPNHSCTVTVEFAPTTNGESDTGTLSAGGQALTVTGSGGPQNLALTKTGNGTFKQNANDTDGSKDYTNDFGQLIAPDTRSATFTVTNNGPGTSEPLTIALLHLEPGYAISNDNCTGNSLASAGTCSFEVTLTTPAGCGGNQPENDIADLTGTNIRYIRLRVDSTCSL